MSHIPEPIADAKAAGFETVAQITCERIRRALHQTSTPGVRVFCLAASSFRSSDQTDGELFDLSESTLQDLAPSDDALVAEVLLREGVTVDSAWDRRVAGDVPVITSSGVTVVPSKQLSEAAVDAVLALNSGVVVFLEDGFAGMDTLKANAFTKARELGITMKTV